MRQQIEKVALGTALLVTAGLVGASAARANNYTYSGGYFSRSNIGNIQGAAGFDGVTLAGTNETFASTPGSSTTLPISDVYFNVGYTGADSAGPNNETASIAVTLDGVTEILNLPFTVDIGMYQDTLTIGSGKLNFNLGNAGKVSLSSVAFGPLTSGGPASALLDGKFTASPASEPASLLLLGTGFLMMAGFSLAVRRRLLHSSRTVPCTVTSKQ